MLNRCWDPFILATFLVFCDCFSLKRVLKPVPKFVTKQLKDHQNLFIKGPLYTHNVFRNNKFIYFNNTVEFSSLPSFEFLGKEIKRNQ